MTRLEELRELAKRKRIGQSEQRSLSLEEEEPRQRESLRQPGRSNFSGAAQPDPEIAETDFGGSANFEEVQPAQTRSQQTRFTQGLGAGLRGLEAGVQGTQAIVQGALGFEDFAVENAKQVQSIQQEAQTFGPQTDFKRDFLGGENVGGFLAGAIGQQIPNLAATIGASLIAGPLGGASARATAGAVTAAERVGIQAARSRLTGQVVGSQASRGARKQLFKDIAERAGTPRNRLAAGVEQAVGRQQAGAQAARVQTFERNAAERLAQATRRHNEAFRKGAERVGGTTAAVTGSGIAAGESSSFLLDPEAEGSIQARSVAALFGAAGEGLTEALPALAVLRNIGLGRTAGHLASKQLAQRGRAATAALGAGKQSVLEAGQEVSAEVIMNVAHRTINENITFLSDEDLMQYLEAATIGGIIGGGVGGVTSIRLRNTGQSEAGLLERQSEREQLRKQQGFEELSPEVREQRAQQTPLERMAGEVTTKHIGRNVLDGTVAGRRARATLDEAQFEQLRNNAGVALRVLADPDVDTTAELQARDGGQVAELGTTAREQVDSLFGEEADLAIEMARQQLLRDQEAVLANARSIGAPQEVLRNLQQRIRDIRDNAPSEQVGESVLDEAQAERQEGFSTADAEFNILSNGEGENAVQLSGDIRSPRIGTLAVPFTKDDGTVTSAARTRVEALQRQNPESAIEVRPAGEVIARTIRRDLGLPAGAALNQNQEAQNVLIEEARAVNARLPDKTSATRLPGRVMQERRLSPQLVRSRPNDIFVFGDNLLGRGRGGQAIIRNEKNAFGIPTKKAPSNSPSAFFGQNTQEEKQAITEAVDRLVELQQQGRNIVLPTDGLGTGRAQLRQRAPEVAEHLDQQLARLNAGPSFDEAQNFLNQFETIVEERTPRQFGAGDEQALSDADLRVRPSGRFSSVVSRENKRISVLKDQGETQAAEQAEAQLAQFEQLRDELLQTRRQLKQLDRQFDEVSRASTIGERRTQRLKDIDEQTQFAKAREDDLLARIREVAPPQDQGNFILEALPKGKLRETQVEVQDPRTKRKVALNLQGLTMKMLGRGNFRGSRRSQQASRRAGQRAQQEGSSGETASREDVAQSLLSGLASLQDRGFALPTIPDDKIIFRSREGGRTFTYGDIRSRMTAEERTAFDQLQQAERADTTGQVTRARKTKKKLRKKETKKAESERSTLQQRLKRVRALSDKIAKVENTKTFKNGGPQAVLKALRKRIDQQNTDNHANQAAIEELQTLERFFAQEVTAQTQSRQQLQDNEAKLRKEIEARNKFLQGLALLKELEAQQRRAGAINASPEARAAALLREFAQDQQKLERDIAGESMTDSTLDSRPTEFGEFVEISRKQREKLAPPWMRDDPANLDSDTTVPSPQELNEETQVLRAVADNLKLDMNVRVVDWVGFLEVAGSSQVKELQAIARRYELSTDSSVAEWVAAINGSGKRNAKADAARVAELTGEAEQQTQMKEVLENFRRQAKTEADLARNDGMVHLQRDQTGRTTAVIWVNENLGAGTEARIGTLHHELGHAVLVASATRATDAEVNAIWADYRNWVNAQKDRKVSGSVQSRRSLVNLVNYQRGDMRNLASLSKAERREMLDFQEWFADNVARFVETNPQVQATIEQKAQGFPQSSRVRRFFASIAKKIKGIARSLGNKGLPAESVSKFLSRVWRTNDVDLQGQTRAVRTFDMWRRLEEQGNKLAGPANAKAIDELVRGFNKDGAGTRLQRENFETEAGFQRAQRRLVQGAHEMTHGPFSIEGFYSTRDAIIAQLTAEERGVLARAFSAAPVRKRLIELVRELGSDAETALSDPYDMLAIGYQLWQMDALKLGPSASKSFTKLHQYAHELAGRTTTAQQAEQILSAIAENKIQLRGSKLFDLAKKNSNLNKQKYVLDSGQVTRLVELRAGLGDKLTAQQARAALDKDGLFKKTRASIRQLIAQDMAAGVFTESFGNKIGRLSEFVVDPDRVFSMEKLAAKQGATQQAVNGMANAMKMLGQTGFARLFMSEAMRARGTKNAAIVDLMSSVYVDVSSTGRQEGMLSRKTRRRATFDNEYLNITESLTEDQKIELRDVMLQRGKAATPEVRAAEKKLRALMNRLRNYATSSGLKMGRIENYFPWVFDPMKIQSKAQDLARLMRDKKFFKDWEELARKHGLIDKQETLTDDLRNQMIRARIDRMMSINNGLFDTTDPPLQSELDPAPHVGAMNERELKFLWDKGTDKQKKLISDLMSDDINGTMSSYISQLVKRAEYARTFGEKGEKLERQIQRARELGATQEDVQLMRNMVHSAMGTVGLEVAPFWKAVFKPINQALKTRPVTRKDGRPFSSKAKAEARLAQLKTGGNIVEVSGGYVIERDLTVDPRRFRQLQAALVVYQNFRLLIGAALTNVADAAGILARTGDAEIAWEAYRVGARETWKSWSGRKLTPAEKRRRRSEQRKLAEEIGAIEAAVLSDQLGQFYGSVFMDGATKKFNDALFKYNGMEGLTRITRLMAVAASRRFIINHTKRSLDGEAESIDLLRAIDLEPSDVRLTEDGEGLGFLTQEEINQRLDPLNITVSSAVEQALPPRELQALRDREGADSQEVRRQEVLQEIARDDRVKRALFRMTDESVLRPSATQRPTWMNDPNWQMFSHLKGFMYTYHERVLRRAYTRLAQGDYGPAIYMMSYVPIIMAADLAREMIQHGPEGDDRKERWTMVDRTLDGMHRSGIAGTFNFIPDMMKTHSLGKNPLVELGGPSVSQINDMVRSMTGVGTPMTTLKRSLPASQLLVDVPSNWVGYVFNDEADLNSSVGELARARALSDFPLTGNLLSGE